MRRIRRLTSNFLVCILCMTTFITQIHMVSAEETEDTPTEEVVQETTPETSEVQEVQDVPQTTEKLDEYYKDGKILIYNYEQLKQIGSDAFVYTKDKEGGIGTGDVVVNEGTQLTYGKDSQYLLMNEIKLDTKTIWNLNDDFTGKIEGEEIKEDETPTLYDKKSDTIYIYNPYQLMVLEQEDSDKEPVMSQDYDAPQFGMGQMIYPNGEDKDYLTYSKDHNYVISKNFSSDKPELVADQLSIDPATTDTEGRDFKGQVVKTIGDKTYILIGNEQQLRKIGSGEKVLGAVYQAKNVGVLVQKWIVDTDNGNPIMLYSGDADLKKEQNGNKDYQIGKVDKAASGLTKGRCGVDQKTGKINPELDYDKATEQTYSSNANYIIFRDIDLSGSNWTPLMFSGNMIGAKASNQSELWLNDPSVKDYSKATSISSGLERPIISNVNVNQTEEMDGSNYIGIGFFATITNEVNVNNIGVSAGTVKVSNLILKNISVQNNTNKHKNTQTVISGVTSLLGGLLGGVVDLVVGLITFGNVKLNLKDTLSALLNARATDPTIYSTGAFAGRLVGDVVVENCDVTGKASVSNINGRTGGFVGYTEGVTQYDGLSKTLNVTVDVLSKLLNVIPGLGLGDLITILLKNGLDVGSLIPTGYKNVVIKNCNVYGLSITTAKDKDYAGGFIGQQVGTQIFNSSVQNSTYSINTNEYGGGFVGISRDADIKGTLTKIGIDLIRGMQPQSLLQDCNLVNCNITVTGTNYQGGFTGAQTNSYAVNCGINGNMVVNATGSYAGGFSGISTVGWVTNLGKDEITDPSLLKTVGKLIADLLSSDPEQAGMLLSLAGIAPSAILGCNLNCTSITVSADKSYVGGILGGGDGVYLAESSAEYLNKLSYWKYGALETGSISQRDNVITGLQSVHARENRAGGVAGSVTTASVTGLLNGTLGVGNYLGFTVRHVTTTGINSGYTVEASENYAGGAIGEAVGGDIDTVTLNQVNSVTAKNRVGGFVGCAGPGDLAGTGGLTINLLGLNHLLKAKNLLKAVEGIRVRISEVHVNGSNDGLTVKATGTNSDGGVVDYVAGGFIGKSHSCEINSSDVSNLKEVSANDTDGSAGGFVGSSQTGGLADVTSTDDLSAWINKDTSVLDINGLLGVVKYLIPSYTKCKVTYKDKGGVSADTAGGFAGKFQSGKINNQDFGEGNYYSVYNLDHVNGQSYAGGFGGNVYSGALADAGQGISILGELKGLNVNVGDLVNLINAYVPTIDYSGVKSDEGFTVTANKIKSDDTNSGSAGGFIGYGSGVQVSHCDVTNLKHTKVTPPKDLEGEDSSNYFGQDSTYAVTGTRYAGGYIGYMDIGSAASVGKGLSVLGESIVLNDVLSALNVVVSTIEHSNVTGGPGGFAIKASWKNTASDASEDDVLGDAGGFAGRISGGHIQNSNSYNFSYIIGQITAGGYVGGMEPGSVARVLSESSVLDKILDVKESLATLVQDFVPTIRNSSTTCIPCGGAVRANASSTTTTLRGMAGGYAGHNEGGHIWGNNKNEWKGKKYIGSTSLCEALRIRSVYGQEIAGGFTGLMESADTASTGSLSLLWGLVKVDNLLSALSVVYPTQKNTAVYGPLAQMDYENWNKWVDFVGIKGGYGSDLATLGHVNNQSELDKILGQYIYGYNVVAGRTKYQALNNIEDGGASGGYIGSMLTGVIENSNAYHTKLVKGNRVAGGFAGEMINGGVASLGSVNVLNIDLPIGLGVVQAFVPVIKQSSVEGYQSGLNVQSTGVNDKELLRYAGGYVGKLIGGQIWGENNSRCKVTKLRRVDGTSYVGGFVGSSKPGSVASVDTNKGEGLVSKLLQKLLTKPNELIQVLNATVATIQYADVESWNPWGIIINGAQSTGEANTSYAKAAGGFAGSISGTVLGKKKDGENAGVSAKGIRSVIGGEYAGGCFGIADVDAGVKVSDKNETQLLKYLLQLGRTDVLDAFRTYVYYGNVSGSEDAGLSVQAYEANKYGQNDAVTYSGVAGGFGGALLNSSVKNSTVTNLSNVVGLNSTGGFVGYSGKSGVVGADKFDVLGNNSWQLLGGALGVMDIFGSHIDDSTVTGINGGYTVQSTGVDEPIAGGFIGYANLARMSNCTAGDSSNSSLGLKQVASNEIAGGFVGKTSFAYLADVKLDSTLVDALFGIVNNLVKALYLHKIQDSDLLKINLGIIKVEAMYDGKLIHVNILGLDISVGLSKKSTDNNQQTDLAIITIGDSKIELPCDKNGIKADNDTKSNISVSLIKANRTKITGSQVYGISSGYDVFGGDADNDKDGSGNNGISGGFVGFNNEGLLQNNDMYLCDVIRGSSTKIGPFSGMSKLDSVYEFNTKANVEGEKNNYRIYRKLDKALDEIKKNATKLNTEFSQDASMGWDIYTLGHMKPVEKYDDLQNAQITNSSGSEKVELNAYESNAKAVLMSDTKTNLNTGESDTPEPSESQDPCDENIKLTINKVWKDLNNFSGIRPKSITVTISRTWTGADNNKHIETVPGYENYEIKGDVNKSTWKKVIDEGLPAYKKVGDDIYYYEYSVTEAEVKGYTTETSKDGFTLTITNKHFPGLPDTGGNGRYLIYLIGLLLLAIYLVTGKKRNKKNQLAEKL